MWLQRVIGGIDPQLVLFKVTSLLGDSIPWVKFHETLITSAKIGEFSREMARRTSVIYTGTFTTNEMVAARCSIEGAVKWLLIKENISLFEPEKFSFKDF